MVLSYVILSAAVLQVSLVLCDDYSYGYSRSGGSYQPDNYGYQSRDYSGSRGDYQGSYGSRSPTYSDGYGSRGSGRYGNNDGYSRDYLTYDYNYKDSYRSRDYDDNYNSYSYNRKPYNHHRKKHTSTSTTTTTTTTPTTTTGTPSCPCSKVSGTAKLSGGGTFTHGAIDVQTTGGVTVAWLAIKPGSGKQPFLGILPPGTYNLVVHLDGEETTKTNVVVYPCQALYIPCITTESS